MPKPKNWPICDFCSAPHPCTAFPVTHDTEVDLPEEHITHRQTGPWAACPTCARLVREGDAIKLAEHATNRYLLTMPLPHDWTLGRVQLMHRQFWASYARDQPEVPLA